MSWRCGRASGLLKEQHGSSAMVRFEKALMLSKSLGEKIYERRANRGLAAASRLQVTLPLCPSNLLPASHVLHCLPCVLFSKPSVLAAPIIMKEEVHGQSGFDMHSAHEVYQIINDLNAASAKFLTENSKC